jgi:hypothetical protein
VVLKIRRRRRAPAINEWLCFTIEYRVTIKIAGNEGQEEAIIISVLFIERTNRRALNRNRMII